jgi:hypothetical protein
VTKQTYDYGGGRRYEERYSPHHISPNRRTTDGRPRKLSSVENMHLVYSVQTATLVVHLSDVASMKMPAPSTCDAAEDGALGRVVRYAAHDTLFA